MLQINYNMYDELDQDVGGNIMEYLDSDWGVDGESQQPWKFEHVLTRRDEGYVEEDTTDFSSDEDDHYHEGGGVQENLEFMIGNVMSHEDISEIPDIYSGYNFDTSTVEGIDRVRKVLHSLTRRGAQKRKTRSPARVERVEEEEKTPDLEEDSSDEETGVEENGGDIETGVFGGDPETFPVDCEADLEDNLTYHEDSLSVLRGKVDSPLGENLDVWVVSDTGAMTQLIQSEYAKRMKFVTKTIPRSKQFSINAPGGGSARVTRMVEIDIRFPMAMVQEGEEELTRGMELGEEISITMSFGVVDNLPVPILWKSGDLYLPAGEDRRELIKWIFQVSWAMEELLRSKALVSQNVEGMRVLFRSHPRIQLRAEEKMATYVAKGCRPPRVLEEMEEREQKRMGKKIKEETSFVKGVGPAKVAKLPIFVVSSGSEDEEDEDGDEDDHSSQEAGEYDIQGHLTSVVESELQKRGKNSVAIKKAILDDKAPLFLWRSVTKLGTEASVAGKFKQYALSWDADQPFNWRKFFRKVDTSCDLVNMSSLMRIKFLVSTAGLKTTSVKDVRQQMVNHLKHIQTRVEYDFNSHPETDLVYWAEMWTRVKMDIILKFWRDPNETAIEEEIDEMLADLRYDDGSTLNNSAGKLLMWYENLVEFQDDVGSVMITTPFWLFDKFRKTLKKKGKVGIQQERIIEEMMTMIVEDPAKYLPRNHGLSDKTVGNLAGKSTSSLPEEVYRILLQEIGDRGHDNKLQVIIRGEEDWMTVSKRHKTGGEEKTPKMTLSAMAVSSTGGGSGGSTKGTPKANFELLCDNCGLFCKNQPGDSCRVAKNGKVFVEELLKFKYSIFEPKDGSRWSVNKSLLEKLAKFFYPKMGWGETEQKEMYAELVKGVNALYDKEKKGGGKSVKSVIVNNVTNSHNTNTNSITNSTKAMIVTSDPKKDRQEKEIARQAQQIKQLKKEAKARQKSMNGDDDAEDEEEEELMSDDDN